MLVLVNVSYLRSRLTDCRLSWNSVMKAFSVPSSVSLFFMPSFRESNTRVTLERRAWMALMAWEKASRFTPTFFTSDMFPTRSRSVTTAAPRRLHNARDLRTSSRRLHNARDLRTSSCRLHNIRDLRTSARRTHAAFGTLGISGV